MKRTCFSFGRAIGGANKAPPTHASLAISRGNANAHADANAIVRQSSQRQRDAPWLQLKEYISKRRSTPDESTSGSNWTAPRVNTSMVHRTLRTMLSAAKFLALSRDFAVAEVTWFRKDDESRSLRDLKDLLNISSDPDASELRRSTLDDWRTRLRIRDDAWRRPETRSHPKDIANARSRRCVAQSRPTSGEKVAIVRERKCSPRRGATKVRDTMVSRQNSQLWKINKIPSAIRHCANARESAAKVV